MTAIEALLGSKPILNCFEESGTREAQGLSLTALLEGARRSLVVYAFANGGSVHGNH